MGRGFERYYGFLGGETDQWHPDLVYDNHPVDQPYTAEEGYHLSKDLADKAIEFIRDAKSIAPTKPWMMYFCPGAAHAPHHVFKEWADRYRGRFDEGYEAIRAGILANQKQLGLLPDDVELSPINTNKDATSATGQPWPALDVVRPWDSLSDDERRLFARMAEVYAGFVSYTDDEIGRLIDYLEESEQLENTIVVVVSDNGASGEGGPNGSFNENKFFNNIPDNVEDNLARIDELGSPTSYNHYNTGWAWAFDTPFPYWKRFAGYEGGTADLCLLSWPKGVAARGEVRGQYVHAVDIVPTLYDLLEVEPPAMIKGYPQTPLEGQSMTATLTDVSAPGRMTQFYSMLGQRALYHQGWLANTVHPPISGWSNFDRDEWELYHIEQDRSQSSRRRRAGTGAARADEVLVVVLRRHLQRTASRRPVSAGDPELAAASAGRAAESLRVLPGHGGGARGRRGERAAPIVHRRRRRRHRLSRCTRSVVLAGRDRRWAQPLHPGWPVALRLQLAR